MRRFTALLLPLILSAAPKTVSTIAGTGVAGFSGDGGPGVAGQVNNPYGLVIGPDGVPHRLGFALGNEFSDHVTEKFNYLWLAHSKLRQCSFGPELRTGTLPGAVTGRSRLRRGNEIIFDQSFLSGEENMSHTIANLEAHHFKYEGFRRPGDVQDARRVRGVRTGLDP